MHAPALPRRSSGAVLGAAVLALVAGLAAAPATTAAPDRPDRPDRSERSAARAALATAQALFAPGGAPAADAARTRSDEHADHEAYAATLVLRELLLRQDDLGPADRTAARELLARPGGPGAGPAGGDPQYGDQKVLTRCSAELCVHRVREGRHRATRAHARAALRVLTRVHRGLVAAGYRPPLPDGRRGGDPRPDVYLADVDSRGYYGYCTSDQPTSGGATQVWAYCVVDNDYATLVSRTGPTRGELLRVTAAHEYFHAVQFGYDVREDLWLLEGTATWVEDEFFDGVDDNRAFLADSPLTAPWSPIDRGAGGFEYGAWIFFRHLTEAYPEQQAGLPTLVRDVWEAADADRAGNPWSTQALGEVLAARGSDWASAVTAFALDGYDARATYEEGAEGRYPVTQPLARVDVRATGTWSPYSGEVDHLSHTGVRVRPVGPVPEGTLLEVEVDAPALDRGSAAALEVVLPDRRVRSVVPLDAEGDGSLLVPFSTVEDLTVRFVDVVLVNASTRYSRCGARTTDFACRGGVPEDDDLTFALRARAVPPADAVR